MLHCNSVGLHLHVFTEGLRGLRRGIQTSRYLALACFVSVACAGPRDDELGNTRWTPARSSQGIRDAGAGSKLDASQQNPEGDETGWSHHSTAPISSPGAASEPTPSQGLESDTANDDHTDEEGSTSLPVSPATCATYQRLFKVGHAQLLARDHWNSGQSIGEPVSGPSPKVQCGDCLFNSGCAPKPLCPATDACVRRNCLCAECAPDALPGGSLCACVSACTPTTEPRCSEVWAQHIRCVAEACGSSCQ